MKHQSFCSRKRNSDVEIHFTKIGHTKIELRVICLRFVLEDTLKRIKNLYVSSKFQLQNMNVIMLIFQGVNCD